MPLRSPDSERREVPAVRRCAVLDTHVTSNDPIGSASTGSGATLAPVPVATARTFLLRLHLIPPDECAEGVGAFQDRDTLIGVAVLGRAEGGGAPALIAVAPDRRALGVGTDLLHALVDVAAARGTRRLLATYLASNGAADALTSAAGLTAGRRRGSGEVSVVLFVPLAAEAP